MYSLAGSQAVDQSICCFGSESWGAGGSSSFRPESQGEGGVALGLSVVRQAVPAVLGLWVGQLACAPGAHPPEVSGVGPQCLNLGAGNWASCESWGCLSSVHSPGAEGGGVPEALAAVGSSLTSCCVPLFSFSF